MKAVSPKRTYKFGLFEVDGESGKLLREGVRVKLQEQPFRVLCLLLDRAGEVVSREQLRQALWPADTYVEFDGSLNAALKRLRYALGDSADSPIYIETLPRRGYRFLAPVAVQEPPQDTLEPAKSPAETQTAEQLEEIASPPIPDGHRNWRRMVGVSFACVILGLLVVASYHRFTTADERFRSRVAQPRLVTLRRSVAVLGFTNTSGRGEDAWLSTALSEMLSTELASGDKLRLVSGEDVAQLRMTAPWTQTGTLGQETASRIGASLSGDLLVLGSYASVGAAQKRQVRLDVRLQDAPSGNILSEVSATGREDDLFHLAGAVAAQLRQKLGVDSETAVEQAADITSLPANPEATRLYSLGLEKLRQFDALPARDLLEQAITADPRFALGHAALSEAWSRLGYDQKAIDEAKKAYDLSNNLPRKDSLFIEARNRVLNKEWDKGLGAYRTLFDFFPDDLDYGLLLADAQTQAGKNDDASATIQLLRKLPAPARDDPRIDLAEEANYRSRHQYAPAENAAARAAVKAKTRGMDLLLARALYRQAEDLGYLGNYDKAIAGAEEAKNIYNTAGDQFGVSAALVDIGRVQWLRGQYEAAGKTFQQVLPIHRAIGNQPGLAMDLRFLGNARAMAGDTSGAKDLYQKALTIYRDVGDRTHVAYTLIQIAWVLDVSGDPAATLKEYDQALAIFRDTSNEEGIAEVLDEGGRVYIAMGDLTKAEEDCRQALEIFRKLGDKYLASRTLSDLGSIAGLKDKLEDSHKTFSEALTINRQIGDEGTATTTEIALASVADEQGRLAEARQLLSAALDYLHAHKDPDQEISAESKLATIALREGNLGEARAAVETARKLLHPGQWTEERYIFDIADARVLAASGKLSEARQALQAVVIETTKHNYVRYQMEARLALCEVEAKTDPAAARTHGRILEKEARAKGFGLIARKALALAS